MITNRTRNDLLNPQRSKEAWKVKTETIILTTAVGQQNS